MDTRALTLIKTYHGITDANCLLWCHGTTGVAHRKVRKFRYPLWKYASASHRVIQCICLGCNMQFYGEYAEGVPLNIPVVRIDSYFEQPVAVRIGQSRVVLQGELLQPFRRITQAMLTDETRAFIEFVQ